MSLRRARTVEHAEARTPSSVGAGVRMSLQVLRIIMDDIELDDRRDIGVITSSLSGNAVHSDER